MAVVDKQIFDLPEITLAILNSGVEIGFVAQVEGYDLDFQVTPDVLVQFLAGKSLLRAYGGSATPINSNGNNGDLYFKTDGSVYQKLNGSWSLIVSQNTQYKPIIASIVKGSTASPFVYTYNGSIGLDPQPRLKRLISGTKYDWDNTVDIQQDGNTFTINGAPDSSGFFQDSYLFYLYPSTVTASAGSGDGTGSTLRYTTDVSPDFLTKSYLNTTYSDYKDGEVVILPSQGQRYTKLSNTNTGDWDMSPLNIIS